MQPQRVDRRANVYHDSVEISSKQTQNQEVFWR